MFLHWFSFWGEGSLVKFCVAWSPIYCSLLSSFNNHYTAPAFRCVRLQEFVIYFHMWTHWTRQDQGQCPQLPVSHHSSLNSGLWILPFEQSSRLCLWSFRRLQIKFIYAVIQYTVIILPSMKAIQSKSSTSILGISCVTGKETTEMNEIRCLYLRKWIQQHGECNAREDGWVRLAMMVASSCFCASSQDIKDPGVSLRNTFSGRWGSRCMNFQPTEINVYCV